MLGVAVISTLLLFFLSSAAGWIATVMTLWIVYFFRDPPRYTPVRDGLLVAPADGLVVSVAAAPLPVDANDHAPGQTATRIAIFLSAFDVHINRAPADGVVERIAYRPGRKGIAFSPKASEDNERNVLVFDLGDGRRAVVVQIAGLVARRIRCWTSEGARLRAGERFGMIRFGSRVEVYLPADAAPLVAEGQRCIGGETVLADLQSAEPARNADAR